MTETAQRPGRGWRRRRLRLFFIVGILLLLVGYVGLDLWAGHRVNVAVARLEQQYGRLDEHYLGVAPAPPEDNRARVVRAATALTVVPQGLDFQQVYNRFLKSKAPTPVPSELRDFVEANRFALTVADAVRTRRQSNWEVGYQYDSPPYSDLRNLAHAIYLGALIDLEAGRPDNAAKTMATGLAVTASLRQEPNLLAQLIRVSIEEPQLENVHRLVSQSDSSRASLEELARWLVENRVTDPAELALVSELKIFNTRLTRTENGHNGPMPDLLPLEVARFAGAYDSPYWLGPLARLSRPFIRLARVRYLRQMGELLDRQAGPRPRVPSPSSATPSRWAFMRRFDGLAFSGLERALETFDRLNSTLGATEVAVALRRFKLEHGNYPDALSELVPAYLANLPIDQFTGQPAVYTRQGAGFHLHAEGGPHAPRVMVSALDWIVSK